MSLPDFVLKRKSRVAGSREGRGAMVLQVPLEKRRSWLATPTSHGPPFAKKLCQPVCADCDLRQTQCGHPERTAGTARRALHLIFSKDRTNIKTQSVILVEREVDPICGENKGGIQDNLSS